LPLVYFTYNKHNKYINELQRSSTKLRVVYTSVNQTQLLN